MSDLDAWPILSHVYKPKPLLHLKTTVSFDSFNPQSEGEVEPIHCTADCNSGTQQDGALNFSSPVLCDILQLKVEKPWS